MVLALKCWKSRSSPGIVAGEQRGFYLRTHSNVSPVRAARLRFVGGVCVSPGYTVDAGWSSPVARQAHNLKVTGSNPVPATNILFINRLRKSWGGFFLLFSRLRLDPTTDRLTDGGGPARSLR